MWIRRRSAVSRKTIVNVALMNSSLLTRVALPCDPLQRPFEACISVTASDSGSIVPLSSCSNSSIHFSLPSSLISSPLSPFLFLSCTAFPFLFRTFPRGIARRFRDRETHSEAARQEASIIQNLNCTKYQHLSPRMAEIFSPYFYDGVRPFVPRFRWCRRL